jgi:hypothetical protein
MPRKPTKPKTNVIKFPYKAPPPPNSVPITEHGRYLLAHCAQLGHVPEKYLEVIVELLSECWQTHRRLEMHRQTHGGRR